MAMTLFVGRYLSRSILRTFHPTLAGVSSSFTLTSFILSSLYSTHAETQHSENAITEFLLNECGLRQSEVTRVMKIKPSLLRTRSSQTAMSAVQCCRDLGFSQTQIKHIIVKNPSFITFKADANIKLKIEFIKTLGLTAQEMPDFICKAPWLLCSNIDRMMKSLGILDQVGVQGELLSLLMSKKPHILNYSTKTLKLKIEYIKNMGFGESSKSFVSALESVIGCTSENLENKMKYMSSIGLLEDEVLDIVKKNPTLLKISKNKMQQNVDFLVGTGGLQAKIVVMNSKLLQYSIEKRLRPRYEVLKSVSAMEHTEKLPSLLTMLLMTEQKFMEKIVKCSSEAAKLYAVLKGKPALSTLP